MTPVGYATHVVFGRVLSKAAGPRDVSYPVINNADDELYWDAEDLNVITTPTTLYTVVPVGDIEGTVSVDFESVSLIQSGGTNEAGQTVLMQDDTFLSVGSTYLLVTRRVDRAFPADAPVYIDPALITLCEKEPWTQICNALPPPDTGTANSTGTMLCGAVCLPTDQPAFRLIAPGYDHRVADTSTDRAALQAQYGDAYNNQIQP